MIVFTGRSKGHNLSSLIISKIAGVFYLSLRGFMLKIFSSGKFFILVFVAVFVCGKIFAGTVDDVLNLTGGQRVKFVWQHCVQGEGKDWDAAVPDYELIGFDTAVDTQPRTILPGPASYANPCISPDGEWVLYTDTTNNTLYKVKWDGTGKQEFAKGYMLCCWRNPADSTQWVYFTEDGNSKGKLVRCRLDNPAKREIMLSKQQAAHTLSVSADGTRAGSEFPWPNAGVAYLPDRGWRQYGGGCNANIAPDNSYRFFHMHHSHMQIEMYEDGGVQERAIVTQPVPNRDAWVPRWSTDVRFLTITGPIAGMDADIYFGRFDDKFTKVEKWVKISTAIGQDTKAYAWVDMGLGQYAGEVPYSISIPAPGEGEWQWDFGDGATAKGTSANHIYEKAGTYTITAKKGETTVKGRMDAQVKSIPKTAWVKAIDARNVNILFTKAMTAATPVFTFTSGTTVERWKMSGDDRELMLTLKADMPAEDTLAISGFTDQNQQPNAVEIRDVKIKVPEWPVNRTAMLYRWENGQQKNFFSLNNKVVPIEIASQGEARLGRNGEMVLSGGAFVNVDMHTPVWQWMLTECSRSNEFSAELIIKPINLEQGTAEKPATILAMFGDNKTQRGFRLGQVKNQLILNVNQEGGDKVYQLGMLPDANAHHVMVTFGKGSILAYIDGKLMVKPADNSTKDELPGRLSWGAVRHLALGGESVYEMVPWQGRVEGLALYSRVLSAEEAAQNAAIAVKRLAARKIVPQVQIQVKLKAKTSVPKPTEIAPYTRALVVYEYEIVKVISGTLTAKTIRVAHWGMRNSLKQPIELMAIGTVNTLTLERFDDRKDLEEEMLIDALPDNPDIDLYVDAEP
jgi:hypothetical protein